MKKKILVVEDNESVRSNIAEILETSGYETFIAENGKVGIEMAIRNQPDIVICDIMMPGMDGYEVLKEMRRSPLTSSVPFIYLTAKNTSADLRKGMELGADDYITKPFTMEELLNAVRIRIEKSDLVKQKAEEKLNQLASFVGYPIAVELGEPLKKISGLSEIMLLEGGGMDKSELIEMIGLVRDSAFKLNRYVKKTLVFYELQVLTFKTDQLELARKTKLTNADALIQKTAQSVAATYIRKEDLVCELQEVDLAISKDFLEVLVNELVENALHYSPRRSMVKVSGVKGKSDYQLSISDEGIGFDQNEIDQVGPFIRFGTDSNKPSGIGLGLAIVKLVCEVFNGSITMNTKPGSGTTIKISIPLAV